MRYWLQAGLLICLSASPLAAQEVPSLPPYARFYVGASCMLGNYTVVYPRIRSYDEGVGALGITGGYQLGPRAAVQVSVARSRSIFRTENTYLAPSGQILKNFLSIVDHRNIAVPVTLRLTGTKRSSHKMQFDALVGFAVIYASYHDRADDLDSLQVPLPGGFERAEQATSLALSVGLGARYRFGRHLEAVADVNLNRTIGAGAYGGIVNVYTTGLRYCFGYR